MTHKKTPKLLAKLAIVSAVAATLPLAINTNIHADSIGIQQAVTTTVQRIVNKTNNLAKNSKTSCQAPEPKPDSGFYVYYGNGNDNDPVMINGKVTPYGHFINALMFLGLLSFACLLVAAIEILFRNLCPNRTIKKHEKEANKISKKERRYSYEAR